MIFIKRGIAIGAASSFRHCKEREFSGSKSLKITAANFYT